MKKCLKRFLSCTVALVLAFSTFTITITATEIQPYGVIPGNRYLNLYPVNYPNNPAGVCLNISTYNEPYNNANVNLYTPTGHDTQRWIMRKGADGWWRLHTAKNEAYALNVWRGSNNYFNADVHTWSNNLKDSAVASLNAQQYGYILSLQNYYGDLNTAASGRWYSGQNVKWVTSATAIGHTWVDWIR